jgi:hypothetical protein
MVFDSIWATWVPYFFIAGIVTFGLSAALLALRRPLGSALLVGPAFGVGLVWLVDQTDTPTTTYDRIVLIGACVLGSLFGAAPAAYLRWVHDLHRNAAQRADASRTGSTTEKGSLLRS